MSVLLIIVVYLIVFGLIWWAIDLMPLPLPFKRWIQVLAIVLLIGFILTAIPGIRGFSF